MNRRELLQAGAAGLVVVPGESGPRNGGDETKHPHYHLMENKGLLSYVPFAEYNFSCNYMRPDSLSSCKFVRITKWSRAWHGMKLWECPLTFDALTISAASFYDHPCGGSRGVVAHGSGCWDTTTRENAKEAMYGLVKILGPSGHYDFIGSTIITNLTAELARVGL